MMQCISGKEQLVSRIDEQETIQILNSCIVVQVAFGWLAKSSQIQGGLPEMMQLLKSGGNLLPPVVNGECSAQSGRLHSE